MTPQAMLKLRKKTHGHWPGLRPQEMENLLGLAPRYMTPEHGALFWGLVDSVKSLEDGSAVLHCFNHSTSGASFPWDTEAVGFGQRIPLRVEGSGTVMAKKTYKTSWHSMDTPFLVFRVAAGASSAMALERVEPGMILAERDTAQLRDRLEVVGLPHHRWPVAAGQNSGPVVFQHWLSRPIGGHLELLEPTDILGPQGFVYPSCPQGILHLESPVVADPGWIIAFHPLGHPRALAYGVVTG